MAKQSQGQNANNNGRLAEQELQNLLVEQGHKALSRQALGMTVFDGELRAGLCIHPSDAFPAGLIVESKWQESGGSIDQKLAYLWVNIVEERYPYPVVVVVDGGGQRPGAIDWLHGKIDGERLLGVFTREEFIKWLNRNP